MGKERRSTSLYKRRFTEGERRTKRYTVHASHHYAKLWCDGIGARRGTLDAGVTPGRTFMHDDGGSRQR